MGHFYYDGPIKSNHFFSYWPLLKSHYHVPYYRAKFNLLPVKPILHPSKIVCTGHVLLLLLLLLLMEMLLSLSLTFCELP
jgi:hypothetical protein